MQKLTVETEVIGTKLNRLDIFNNGKFIGEYERAQEADIDRKKQEINCASELLIEVYNKHGQFVVRWNGAENKKSIRVNDIEVASIPRECWKKPSWV